MSRKLTMPVTDDVLGEIEVEITGTYIPAERGSREDGLQMEPDYDAHFEDVCATYEGKPYELTDDDTEKAEELLMENVKNDCDGEW